MAPHTFDCRLMMILTAHKFLSLLTLSPSLSLLLSTIYHTQSKERTRKILQVPWIFNNVYERVLYLLDQQVKELFQYTQTVVRITLDSLYVDVNCFERGCSSFLSWHHENRSYPSPLSPPIYRHFLQAFFSPTQRPRLPIPLNHSRAKMLTAHAHSVLHET